MAAAVPAARCDRPCRNDPRLDLLSQVGWIADLDPRSERAREEVIDNLSQDLGDNGAMIDIAVDSPIARSRTASTPMTSSSRIGATFGYHNGRTARSHIGTKIR
jgi:hypothetical protein